MNKITATLCLAILGIAFVPANAQILPRPAFSKTVSVTTLKKRHHRHHHHHRRHHHHRKHHTLLVP